MDVRQIEEFHKYFYPSFLIYCQFLNTVHVHTGVHREVQIMNRLRSPYVLNFIGASFVPGKICLVTEICSKGTVIIIIYLKSLLIRQPGQFKPMCVVA